MIISFEYHYAVMYGQNAHIKLFTPHPLLMYSRLFNIFIFIANFTMTYFHVDANCVRPIYF